MNATRTSHGRHITLVCLLLVLGGCARNATTNLPVGGDRIVTTELVVHSLPQQQPASLLVPSAVDDTQPPTALKAKEAPIAEPPIPSCPAADDRVLLIGDSLSAGLGPHMAKRAERCGTVFFHHGVVGSHVTEWAHDSWVAVQLERAKPNVVIVSLGGNDFPRLDRDNVQKGIAQLNAKVAAAGAELLWISPPTMPFADRVGAREMWQEALGTEKGRGWFATEELEIPRTEDRVHPTINGYDDLSGRLWTWLSTVRDR